MPRLPLLPPAGAPGSLGPHPLLPFALQHMVVKTNVCSRQKMSHGYLMQTRTVPDYNLIFVTRGRVVWVIDGIDHLLQNGDLVIVPPAVEHHAHSLTRQVTLESIHVEVTLPGGQDLFHVLMPPRQQAVPPGSRLDRYLRLALDEYDHLQSAALRQVLPYWSPLVIHALLTDNAARGLLAYRNPNPLILGVLEALNRRLDRPTTLEELAALSGFTAQHLNRVFRRELGVTPLQYLHRMRMEQAAGLLRDNRHTVRGIGRQVGFDDPYYFSRMFRQHFGCSPAQYRTQLGDR